MFITYKYSSEKSSCVVINTFIYEDEYEISFMSWLWFDELIKKKFDYNKYFYINIIYDIHPF